MDFQKICLFWNNFIATTYLVIVQINTLMTKFKALQSAIVTDSKGSNRHGGGLDGGLNITNNSKVIETIQLELKKNCLLR